MSLQFGLDTFGDLAAPSHAQTVRDVVEQGVLADRVGIDFFGVGEHHRDDFAISAPEIVLAAIAARTRRIRLGSAVTVLSSDDPIRVYQRFSTLDALSSGRAEVILGRGSFTESFPLFGFDLRDYERLFEEKLDLFAAVLQEAPVTWSGSTRPALQGVRVYPPLESGRLRSWIGVGGSPDSVVRAARYGMPLLLAIIGGDPARFRPYVDLHRRAHAQLETEVQPVGVHSPGFVAPTDAEAVAVFYPHYKAMRDRIGRDRGWPEMQRAEFDREVAEGSLYVGSPETVARKIAATVAALELDRFQLKYSAGTLPHAASMQCIDLFGTQVVPAVRALLKK